MHACWEPCSPYSTTVRLCVVYQVLALAVIEWQHCKLWQTANSAWLHVALPSSVCRLKLLTQHCLLHAHVAQVKEGCCSADCAKKMQIVSIYAWNGAVELPV